MTYFCKFINFYLHSLKLASSQLIKVKFIFYCIKNIFLLLYELSYFIHWYNNKLQKLKIVEDFFKSCWYCFTYLKTYNYAISYSSNSNIYWLFLAIQLILYGPSTVPAYGTSNRSSWFQYKILVVSLRRLWVIISIIF